MQGRPETDTFPSRRQVPLSPYREKATAERPRPLPEHPVQATAVPQHLERTGRGHHANSAVTDVRHGGSALPRPRESAQASLIQWQRPKRSRRIPLRQGFAPARPRVLVGAGSKGAAAPSTGQSDLLSCDSRLVEYPPSSLVLGATRASQEHSCPRIARATSLERSLLSPAGPTHD